MMPYVYVDEGGYRKPVEVGADRFRELVGMDAPGGGVQDAFTRMVMGFVGSSPGNISNLFNRQRISNPDGSFSTTRSMSINEDGKEVLIPTIIDGKQLSQNEAVEYYRRTGEHLGKFDTVEEAESYAKNLSESQGLAGSQKDLLFGGTMPPAPGADPRYQPPPASETWKRALSMGVDFAPGVGDVKALQEAASGQNLITGEKLGGWERALSGAGALPFLPNVAGLMAGKNALKAPLGKVGEPKLHPNMPISSKQLNEIVEDVKKLYPEAEGVSVVGTYSRLGETPSTGKSHDVDVLIRFPENADRLKIENRFDDDLWNKWRKDKIGTTIDFLKRYGEKEPSYGQHQWRLEEGLPTPEIPIWKAPKSGLALAEELAAKGADADEIWNKTGWRSDPKGNWAFEIDDSAMKVMHPNNQQLKQGQLDTTGDEIRKWQDIRRQLEEYTQKEDLPYNKLKEANDMYEHLGKKIQDAEIKIRKLYDEFPERNMKLSEAIDHPELFKQYPQLKGYDVAWTNGTGGYISGNKIVLGANADKHTIIHEIQHAIQEIEGWPKGGSPDISKVPKYRKEMVDTLIADYKDELYKLRPENFGNKTEYLEYKNDLISKLRDVETEKFSYKRPWKYYHDLYGEFQARDAASRADWTTEQRKMVRPYSSEMEPKEGWIYRGGSGSAMSQEWPSVRQAMNKIPKFDPGMGDTISALHKQFPGMSKAKFDEMVLSLWREGKITLHQQDLPKGYKGEMIAVPSKRVGSGGKMEDATDFYHYFSVKPEWR